MQEFTLNRSLRQLDELMVNETGLSQVELVKAAAALSHEMGHVAADAMLEANPRLIAYADDLTAGFYQYAVAEEDAEIQRIKRLQLDSPVAYSDIMTEKTSPTYNRVRDIFNWLDFANCRRFVMIGCGQLPISALHVSDRTEVADIVCIDIRHDAVADVGYIASKLGRVNLSAEVSDGQSFDYAGTQIVYIANMVRGKDDVVARVLQTADQGVQIVVRVPVGLGRLWTEDLKDPAALGVQIAERGHVSAHQGRDQLLVQVNGDAA